MRRDRLKFVRIIPYGDSYGDYYQLSCDIRRKLKSYEFIIGLEYKGDILKVLWYDEFMPDKVYFTVNRQSIDLKGNDTEYFRLLVDTKYISGDIPY